MATLSRAGQELMLLMMKANVPSAPLLVARSEFELASLAIKHGIQLPDHLAHLAIAAMARDETDRRNAAAEVPPAPIVDRQPRRTGLHLVSAAETVAASAIEVAAITTEANTDILSRPSKSRPKKARARRRQQQNADAVLEEDDDEGAAAATASEGPPSSRRQHPKRVRGKRHK